MKKLILLMLTITLALSTTHAQTKQDNSLLWEVSGNGLKAPSYLFGTYHLVGKSLVDSLPAIKTYFNASKAVVGEVIIDSVGMASMVNAMILANDTTLDKLFTAEEYKNISDYITSATPMDMRMIMHFKPAAVGAIVAVFNAPKTITDGSSGIDSYFQQEGKQRGYKVMAFETMKEQTDLLFGSSMDKQKKELLDLIRKKDEGKAEGRKLYAMYLKQDLIGLNKMMDEGATKEKSVEFNDKMLKNRNLRWMTQIPGIMSAQPTFIAVGALHLVGKYGLIEQLRLKGYTVKAVKI
ncbi:MAG: TraB/GumN family protein [Bacteroidota bacterium]